MCLPAYSQSMTDEQVVSFVQKETEKGSTQQQIVSKLLRRGVTTSQLRQIRKKYEAEQANLGASDLTGRDAQKTPNRLRQERQERGEAYQMRNQYMLQSQFRVQNRNYGTIADNAFSELQEYIFNELFKESELKEVA